MKKVDVEKKVNNAFYSQDEKNRESRRKRAEARNKRIERIEALELEGIPLSSVLDRINNKDLDLLLDGIEDALANAGWRDEVR